MKTQKKSNQNHVTTLPVIFIFDMLNLNPKADNKCQTLNAYNGTGGNNMPLVLIGESNEQS